MKIVLWIANESNQKALANKLSEHFEIIGIVTETRKSKRKITLKILIEKIIEKIFLTFINKTWFDLLNHYNKKYPKYPEKELLDVENINNEDVYKFTEKLKPDLILVSGTRLVKEHMFKINPSIGILNLHTGLSPYIKGGPNCTNWCLSNNDFHLIGNTIMWIDKGIDTGNILTTEFTHFDGKESFFDIHLKVMEHAHDLYIKAVNSIQEHKIENIPQISIDKGKTYFTKDWKLKQRFKLKSNLKNWNYFWEKSNKEELRIKIKTIHLK